MENEIDIYDKELAEAFADYCKVKQDCPPEPGTERESEWRTEFYNAMYRLFVALGQGSVYANIKFEFYDNVAQCAFRKGRPINLMELIEKRKVAFLPTYIVLHLPEGDKSLMVIGIKHDDIGKYLKNKSVVKGDLPEETYLPFKSLFELGVENSEEGESLSFLIYQSENEHFEFSFDIFRLIASGNINRERFMEFVHEKEIFPNTSFPSLDYFNPTNKA